MRNASICVLSLAHGLRPKASNTGKRRFISVAVGTRLIVAGSTVPCSKADGIAPYGFLMTLSSG